MHGSICDYFRVVHETIESFRDGEKLTLSHTLTHDLPVTCWMLWTLSFTSKLLIWLLFQKWQWRDYILMILHICKLFFCLIVIIPASKVDGANMGSIWGRQDPGGLHVGPMNFAIWDHQILAKQCHILASLTPKQKYVWVCMMYRCDYHTEHYGILEYCVGHPVHAFISKECLPPALPKWKLLRSFEWKNVFNVDFSETEYCGSWYF